MAWLVLLGPQRFTPTVLATLDSLGVNGRVAVVTAGWQERESEVDELRQHVGRELTNLRLYERAEEVFEQDPELASAWRERQERLRELQELYRLRLDRALDAARELLVRRVGNPMLLEHRRAAIRALRTLDRQHLVHLRRLHAEFEQRWAPTSRPAVARHRGQLRQLLESSTALAVAGGHVAVLLNRLRLFDILPWVNGRPLVAWSAGAMALGERVVLFHDSPPQGPGNAEVLEVGLGVFPRVVPLPHARKRLCLEDPVRLALFARRFAPAHCVLLEAGTRLDWDGAGWRPGRGTRRLGRGGTLRAMECG